MGLFSKIFGNKSELEKALEDQYIQMYVTELKMPHLQAEEIVRGLLKKAKQEARRSGLSNNLCEEVLKREATDEKLKALFAKKRKDGVTDEDILWWWDMTELERQMLHQDDQFRKLAVYIKSREEDCLDENEAKKKIKHYYPVYGDPTDDQAPNDADHLLPFELKDRINIFVIKQNRISPALFKKRLAKYSSFNAMVREKIREGDL